MVKALDPPSVSVFSVVTFFSDDAFDITHMPTLAETLARETREGELYEVLPDGRLRCYACGHCCPLPEGAIGVCKVRFNEGGRLRVPWGYVGGAAVRSDREEAVLSRLSRRDAPTASGCSAATFTAATARTGSRRRRCAIRRPSAPPLRRDARSSSSRRATVERARSIVSTYNEPLITSEWAVAVFKEAKAAGPRAPRSSPTATARRRCSSISGRGSICTRSISRASTTATTASSAARSSRCSTRSAGCTTTGFWLEIVTLVIPGFNDSRRRAARV